MPTLILISIYNRKKIYKKKWHLKNTRKGAGLYSGNSFRTCVVTSAESGREPGSAHRRCLPAAGVSPSTAPGSEHGCAQQNTPQLLRDRPHLEPIVRAVCSGRFQKRSGGFLQNIRPSLSGTWITLFHTQRLNLAKLA